MIKRIINCLCNDYDVFIGILIIILLIKILILHHKYEEKKEKERPPYSTRPWNESYASRQFVSAIIGFITICVFYLFFRFAGVLSNQFIFQS